MFKPATLNRLFQTTRHFSASARPAFRATFIMSQDEKPTGPKATSGIELFTFGTPNGHKASIILEELKEAYGKEYTSQAINIMENIQKEPWYLKINPNGRIPAIIDHDRNDFPVMEGLAILSYLTRHYDPKHIFSFDINSDDYSRAEQWMAWQHGGIGPMQGQANHFHRLAKERIPYPTQRYVGETERLYGVLDQHLQGRQWIVGDKYSIADIANFSWVNYSSFAGVDITQFKNLKAWADRINAREAVKKGMAVPHESKIINPSYAERLKEDKEFADKEKELAEITNKAKEQYGYKYSSP